MGRNSVKLSEFFLHMSADYILKLPTSGRRTQQLLVARSMAMSATPSSRSFAPTRALTRTRKELRADSSLVSCVSEVPAAGKP